MHVPPMLREMWRACHAVPLVVAVVLLSGCGAEAPPGPSGGEREQRPLPVTLAAAEHGVVDASWRGTTTLHARRDAEVAARVGGDIAEVLAEVGDGVERGQALARLDAERLRLEAERAEAIYRQRRAEAERSQRLLARELISEDEHERAISDRDTARSEHELAALSLREATIRAPFAGQVAERHIREGNSINAGEAAFRIVDLDSLEATLSVPEREVAPLAVGQPVQLRADARPQQVIDGEVLRISPAVDGDTGTVAVTVGVAGSAHRLMPGMFVRAAIIHDRRAEVLTIPQGAIRREDGADAVFVAVAADGGLRAERRELTLGYRSEGRVEVRDGLAAGERVVVSGVGGLRDGMRLQDIAALEPDGEA